MDKAVLRLAEPFPANQWPSLPCPTCVDGRLAVAKEGHRIVGETAASAGLRRGRAGWTPDDWSARFAALLTCGNPDCSESVEASGSSYSEPYLTRDGDLDYEETLRVRFIDPSVRLLVLPNAVPAAVVEEVDAACGYVWRDAVAAGARLRLAVERVLDHQKIKKAQRSKNGVRRLSAHERIQLLREKKSEVGELLEAVKWLGNEASHLGALTTNDFLDGATIFEHAMRLLYDRSHVDIQRKAKEINRRRGTPRT